MSHCNEFLRALGSEIGVPLALECAQVDIEVDDLTVHFRADESQDSLTAAITLCEVGENPTPDMQAALYVRCLKGQYCFAETSGCSLGLSPDDRRLVLQAQWNLQDLPERKFIDAFEAFIQTARLWQPLLLEITENTETQNREFQQAESTMDMLRI